MGDHMWTGKPFWYVTSQLRQLSLDVIAMATTVALHSNDALNIEQLWASGS